MIQINSIFEFIQAHKGAEDNISVRTLVSFRLSEIIGEALNIIKEGQNTDILEVICTCYENKFDITSLDELAVIADILPDTLTKLMEELMVASMGLGADNSVKDRALEHLNNLQYTLKETYNILKKNNDSFTK